MASPRLTGPASSLDELPVSEPPPMVTLKAVFVAFPIVIYVLALSLPGEAWLWRPF
jgi:hypothetical protein